MSGKKGRIYLVDDDELIVSMLARSLKKEGYETQVQTGPENILAAVDAWQPDLLLLDINLGAEQNGLDILKAVKGERAETPVVMLTADDSAESAIAAMKLGAADYLTKPFNIEEVQIVIAKILENSRLKEEAKYLRRACAPCAEQDMVGDSPLMRGIKAKAEKLARAQVQTILITGPSGTGKEVLARYVHNWRHFSQATTPGDRNAPFIPVNCTALPEHLIESELFGHTKGAFTDAKEEKKGVFELADGGTLLLDEIGDMRPELQGKLLRVLEDRRVRRLGGKVDIGVEVTVIAATNKDLKQAVADGSFREDLYYRLSTFAIDLPSLHQRPEDIPRLAHHFLVFFAAKYLNRDVKGFSAEAEQVLGAYKWPGNIRELRNVIERCVVLENTETITPDHLPLELRGGRFAGEGLPSRIILPAEGLSLEEVEKELIRQALDRAGHNQTKAAKLLRISYDSLRYQAKKHGLM
jgi:DNA-binding NtrC family response regulator